MQVSHYEYNVRNYLGNVIGEPTLSLDEAVGRAERNQRSAVNAGDHHYDYHVVARKVYVGPWKRLG